MNTLTDETRSRQIPVTPTEGFPDKVRVGDTVAEFLEATRPATVTKGDQLISGAVKVALIESIVAGRFAECHDALGRLTGRTIPDGYCPRCGAVGLVAGTPSGKPLPGRGN